MAGATILGDGSVVLILDVPGLWITEEGLQVTHEAGSSFAAKPEERVAVASAPQRDRAVVMVVDDSITVRKVTQRHARKREGCDVLTREGRRRRDGAAARARART
ncbi:MAG: hypothetical protein MZV65_12665 [Chromatiales bacterium]|nr:hypothetical protein [Chromatiales bacterium]